MRPATTRILRGAAHQIATADPRLTANTIQNAAV
jgi:hypothetical protein